MHREDALSTGESSTDPEPASEGGDSVVTAAQGLPDFTAPWPLQEQPACWTERVPSSYCSSVHVAMAGLLSAYHTNST